MSLDVGVIGCGTAGAAAALFLARAGHRVTVYDRVPEPGPVGAGILLQPTGQAVLARLDLYQRVAARAAPVEQLLCLDHRGRKVVDLRYADLGVAGTVGLGVHRGVLFDALFDAVRADARIAIRLGRAALRVRGVEGGRRRVELEGGTGDAHELVVIADGAESTAQLLPELRPRIRPYPWGALWFVALDREGAHGGRLHQRVRGARRLLGLLPTGQPPGGDAAVVSLFWSIRGDRVDAWRAQPLDVWRDEVIALEPRAAPVVEQVRSHADLLFARYADVRLRRWHGDRIVVLGDAAHATSPQLGQGANLALWDAMVLADCVTAQPIERALAEYSRARRAHVRYYQFAARWLTPLFQSESRLGGWLRDWLLPLGGRLGFGRRLMLETMAGLRRGIVRRSLPVAPLRVALGTGADVEPLRALGQRPTTSGRSSPRIPHQ